MQLLGDSITVLGSRMGVAIDPVNKKSYLIRHGMHPGIPLNIEAGIDFNGQRLLLPLCVQAEPFSFHDQGSTATTMTLGGIDPGSGIHLKLSIRIPFRPRDEFFSTIPVIDFELQVRMLPTQFRWDKREADQAQGKMFLRFAGEAFSIEGQQQTATATYSSPITMPVDTGTDEIRGEDTESLFCVDRLIATHGSWQHDTLWGEFNLTPGSGSATIAMSWCTHDEPVLQVLGQKCPFRYISHFKDIDAVVSWVKQNPDAIKDNSQKVDAIIHGHTLGENVSALMAQTLHSWLMNTWWVIRPEGENWFSVWEGCCYFHSTVDVEYTQSPMYLAMWPELLGYELDQWPLFAKEGKELLGEAGRETQYLAHDIGQFAQCDQQRYHHDMHVEESTNYILMAYAYWRRSGDDTRVKRHVGFMRHLMDFIMACDTTGNGIPDLGCANTIDDASPAIQFGKEQIYLGVKAMAALQVGKIMLEYCRHEHLEPYENFAAKALNTLEGEAWKADHYIVTLSRTLQGVVHPWTGEPLSGELEGWDAYHIYTQNGLALLDMTGYRSGLNEKRLRRDIETSVENTLGEYGCRHTSYVNDKPQDLLIPGLASTATKVGWVSMNMLRDIAAAYRGIDLFGLSACYWNWQSTTNSQQLTMFFETFHGNNLHFYPRGVALFGYFDAVVGFTYDAIEGRKNFAPVRASLSVPLLLFADWEKGEVPKVNTWLEEGRIRFKV